MTALLTLAALAPLLYLPGALIAVALLGRANPPDPLERHFERILLGTLLNGWLALTLGQLGVFSIWLHLALIGAACAVAALRIRRSGGPQALRQLFVWGPQALRPPSAQSAALIAVLLAFTLLVARPFEVVLGVRDAGVYASAGIAMARTGSLVQRDPLLAEIAADQQSSDPGVASAAAQAETNFLGTQNARRFIATRLRAAGFFVYEGDLASGRVHPQGLHLFTAWVGLLAAIGGPAAGLLAPGVTGILGVWSVAMLARRLAGPLAGTLAAVILALNAAQVWFSRYSTTETTAQLLTFAGLYAFAVMHAQGRGTKDEGPRHVGVAAATVPVAAAAHTPHTPTNATDARSSFSALLAGLALGQLALARIEFFLVVAPVALYLIYRAVARRWSQPQTALALSIGAMLTHAVVQFATTARAYVFDTLFARLQDYAVTALAALPFLTPTLREIYLLRPCSRLTLQPCPPVAGMDPTTDAPWNVARIAGEFAALLLLALALVALWRWGRPLIERAEGAALRAAPALRAALAAAILALGAYAYLVRPQILTAETIAAIPACLAPDQLRAPTGPCLALQGYVGAPIATPGYADPLAAWLDGLPRRLRGQQPPTPEACEALRREVIGPQAKGLTVPELVRDRWLDPESLDEATLDRLNACDRLVLRVQFANAQANLVRVGWYTSPLGVALGVIGIAMLARRASAASWLTIAVTLTAAVVFVRLTYGTSDQHYIYILRRYIPQVYPALALGAAVALAALYQNATSNMRTGVRRAQIVAWWTLQVVLLAFLLVTGRPIFSHTEYAGALDQLEAAASPFGPDDVLLLRGGAPTYSQFRDIPDVVATPLTFIYGVNALTIKSREPAAYAADLARAVETWRERGRAVYLAVGPSGALPLPGLALEPAGRIRLDLREFEQLTDQKPRNIQDFTLDFALYRVVPASDAPAAQAALAPDDYAAQLRGFYRAEQIDGVTASWTDGDALLRVEPPATASALTLILAGGERPQALGPARACLTLSPADRPDAPLAERCFTLTEAPAPYTLPLDAPLAADEPLILRLSSEPWIPARDDPRGTDPRSLGVQFGGLTAHR